MMKTIRTSLVILGTLSMGHGQALALGPMVSAPLPVTPDAATAGLALLGSLGLMAAMAVIHAALRQAERRRKIQDAVREIWAGS